MMEWQSLSDESDTMHELPQTAAAIGMAEGRESGVGQAVKMCQEANQVAPEVNNLEEGLCLANTCCDSSRSRRMTRTECSA
jgi:hypothetical protein